MGQNGNDVGFDSGHLSIRAASNSPKDEWRIRDVDVRSTQIVRTALSAMIWVFMLILWRPSSSCLSCPGFIASTWVAFTTATVCHDSTPLLRGHSKWYQTSIVWSFSSTWTTGIWRPWRMSIPPGPRFDKMTTKESWPLATAGWILDTRSRSDGVRRTPRHPPLKWSGKK